MSYSAITTYNFKYYFYTDYYTYKADRIFQVTQVNRNEQDGTDCYSYIHTKSSIIQKDNKC